MLIKKPFKKGLGAGIAPYYAAAASLSPVELTFQAVGIASMTVGAVDTIGPITIIGADPSANRRVTVSFATNGFSTSGPLVSAIFTPDSGAPVASDPVIISGTNSSSGISSALLSAILPTGDTFTLTLTFTSTLFGNSRFTVYTLDNSTLSSTTPAAVFNSFTTSPSTLDAVLPAGSGLIAHLKGFAVTTESWTAGVTSDGQFGQDDWGHVSNASASVSYAVTNTWTVSGSGNPDLTLWVYR